MQVEAAMTRTMVTVELKTTLKEAEELMQRGRFRHLPVVDGGRLAGIVSEREVRPPSGVSSELAAMLAGRPVTTVMRSPVITVAPRDALEQAAQLLHDNKIGALPVIDGATLVGIITTSDVFRAFVQTTGILEPSTRVEIPTESLPDVLTAVAEVARHEHAAITGLVTERDPATGRRQVVVRFATIQGPRLVAALRAQGLTVAGPESEPIE